ncbi:hypothetical protein PybrP1_009831 [[Pythium] brassicae (nom. inval.)]|nr:hypothetical protein PybrP1_009831 [[Pythium] brassicae (nom. inval.)]
MEQLARRAQQTQQLLAAGDGDWAAVANTLEGLAADVEALCAAKPQLSREVARLLLPLSSDLGAQITGYRSKLVGHVCKSVARVVVATRRDFRELANELLPSLVNTAKGASGAVRTPGAELFKVISEHVRFDLQLLRKIFAQSPQEKIRVLMLEQVAVVLACWQKAEIEPQYSDVLEIIRRGLLDPAQSVRSASRDAFCSLAALWEERVDELVDIPTAPALELLLKEKPRAAISLAIAKKRPELLKKVASATAGPKKLARQRSLIRMSPPLAEPSVEIHVATPPEKQRPAVGDRSHEGDAQPTAAPLSRRLFHDANDNLDKRRYPWAVAYAGYFFLALAFIFGASGALRAVATVRDTHDYHEALKTRVRVFEASISESYASVRKLEENYAVWSEYVHLLAEEDETHALSLLETLQHQVERWQQEMQRDLAQFKQSLAVDVLDAALAPLLQNATAAAASERD